MLSMLLRIVVVSLVVAAAVPLAAAQAGDLVYEHVPASAVRYEDDLLEVSWEGDEFQIVEASLYAGWVKLMDIHPGHGVHVPIRSQEARVFVAGTALRLATRELFLFLTPIWDPSCPAMLPTDFRECSLQTLPGGCSATNTETCANGGTEISVTCEGHTGTCTTGGSKGQSVECSARTSTIQAIYGAPTEAGQDPPKVGETLRTTTEHKIRRCP